MGETSPVYQLARASFASTSVIIRVHFCMFASSSRTHMSNSFDIQLLQGPPKHPPLPRCNVLWPGDVDRVTGAPENFELLAVWLARGCHRTREGADPVTGPYHCRPIAVSSRRSNQRPIRISEWNCGCQRTAGTVSFWVWVMAVGADLSAPAQWCRL